MDWETIRIVIDVLSVVMFILMCFLLWFAYKGYRKVTTFNPLDAVSNMMNPTEEEDISEEDDRNSIHEMELSKQVQ